MEDEQTFILIQCVEIALITSSVKSSDILADTFANKVRDFTQRESNAAFD